MSDEKTEQADGLVLAVRALDKAYSNWMRSENEDDFPPALVQAVGVVCALVSTSFPKDDRLMALFMSCTQLAAAFQGVIEEEPGSARGLVQGIENVLKHLGAHEQEQEVPLVPVATMLHEYKNSSQRYMWIAKAYGDYDTDFDIWKGPFFSSSGVVLSHLIEKEAATPGSVLGDDFKPMGAQRKAARIRAAAIKQLSALQTGLFRPEGGAVPEKASVLDMLKEGQFPDVIARVKGVPLNTVLAQAATAGIKVRNRDDELNRAALEASSDPIAEAGGYQKPTFDDPEDDEDEDFDDEPEATPEPEEEQDTTDTLDDEAPPAVIERMTSDELTDFAVGFLAENPMATAHEILATAVTELGKSASRQMLAPILKTLRSA